MFYIPKGIRVFMLCINIPHDTYNKHIPIRNQYYTNIHFICTFIGTYVLAKDQKNTC